MFAPGEPRMTQQPLDALFKPEAVAVIGASPREASFGRRLLDHLLDYGFLGKVYPVNPRYEEILGLDCYPSVSAIGQPVDLAVIAVPIAQVPAVIGECGTAGIPAAVILSTGGREVGPEGEKLEADIRAAAAKTGLRFLGPGSWGCCVRRPAWRSPFRPIAPSWDIWPSSPKAAPCAAPSWAGPPRRTSASAISSVSGPKGTWTLLISSTTWAIRSPHSIIIYMENLTRHRKFMSACRSVSRVKPIIVVKAGRRPAEGGEEEPDEDAAYDAAFRRAGIIRVDTVGQLFRCAEALGKMAPPVRGIWGSSPMPGLRG